MLISNSGLPGELFLTNRCTGLDPHLTTSMEAAPDLKKSVVSSMAGTLLRMPFQMFCDLKNKTKKHSQTTFIQFEVVYCTAVKKNQLTVYLP